ncbi:MAG: hypothetical protein ABI792_07315 [bacterium]
MFRLLFIIIISMALNSCNKEIPLKEKVTTPKTDVQQDEAETDTTMTIEEAFSSALVQNIIGDDGDDELQLYLEEQIYPMVSKSDKVTLDRVSSSIYLLSYEENGVMKNLLIQKFYNPGKDEFVFEKSETHSNAVKQFVK